jgi:hypothetical protein
MSSPSAVVVPTKGGELVPGAAASATPMKGGMMLSPLPLAGGRRKSKKLSKKVLKMLKKMTPKQLKKAMKGGEEGVATETATTPEVVGARRRKTRRSKKSRRSGLLY